MATIQEAVEALAEVVQAVDGIDSAHTTSFLPALDAGSVVALLVPFEQEANYEQMDLSGQSLLCHHTTKAEFWVKHDTSDPERTLTTARNVGFLAMRAIVAGDGTGYTLDREQTFRERVDTGFVTVANVPWLVVHLYVPLETEVTL